MKKFLAVFDGYKMSEGTLDYAIQITKLREAHLVGVFLDASIYHSYGLSEEMSKNKDLENVIQELNRVDANKRHLATNLFRQRCEEAGVRFSFHKNESMTIRELKNESMYADLIFINQHETFSRQKEPLPTHFIKDLLGEVQCPVLVVPSLYRPVENLVLLYDGAPSALYAIKMFSYILGNPKNLPVKVFTVKEKKKAAFNMPDNKEIREFIKRYFPKATFAVANGNPETEISGYLGRLPENQLVVLGAYQRSEISRLFKISMADILMKELEIPLFIAPNK